MEAARNFSITSGAGLILTDMGIQPSNVLRRAGLPDDLFTRSSFSLTPPEYYAFWQALEEEADDPELPIAAGRAISVETFAPPVFAALCSPNLDVAMERIARHKPLIGPLRLQLRRAEDGITVACIWPEGPEPPQILVAMELIFWVALARLATRFEIRPLRVTSPVAFPRRAAYRQYFGVPVTLGERASVTFSAEDAARPFLTANEAIWEFFEPELRRRLSELEAGSTMSERVTAVLLEMLPSGEASIEAVAGRLMIGPRTLQRRLREEGTSYQAVLQETREALARHYLSNSNLPAAEISFLLGYDDPNSFYRAFHGWTGETPEGVRTAAIDEAPSGRAGQAHVH